MSDNNDKRTSRPSNFAIPTQPRRGIDAVHVNAAREMVQLHTRGRAPPTRQPPQPQSPRGGSRAHAPVISEQSKAPVSRPNISIPLEHDGECKNPQCQHCGSIIIPAPQSSFPLQDKPSIKVNGWEIYTIKKPILSSAELDHLGDTKFEFPLPEMIFGNNFVRIRYTGGDGNDIDIDNDNGHEIWFNSIDALDTLEDECHLKVSYHEEWLQSRQNRRKKQERGGDAKTSTDVDNEMCGKVSELTDMDAVKPYDWTYSPNYVGHTRGFDFVVDNSLEIPVNRLMNPDPILFFDEMILYEDELADNGISMLSIKIRVMPTCLLLLCRFFLRIDNVIFRIRDCRVFIDFNSNEVIREYKLQECDYDEVLKLAGGGSGGKVNNDPKRLLRDQNWVSLNIPVVNRTIEKCTV
ncbi:TIP41 [Candida margitis]|uniref:TIP41 n=1 Tax=Candida margitis TaxID=1775924 RepID=UPI002225FDBF|nr:TIP41 [Candida margitis]KAI5967201.1 TIP41 [Candida margitis]